MRPTKRGLAVLAMIALGFVLHRYGGPRSLNAIVVPLVVTIAAAVITVVVTDRPDLRRQDVVA